MIDKIIEKLIEFLPLWYLVLLVIIVGVLVFYYKRFKPLEDRTRHADCKNKNSKIDEMASDIKQLRSDFINMKEDLIAIKSILVQKYPNSANIFSMKKSPRKLNEMGEKLFADVNGKRFLNEHQAFFFKKIDEYCPKTAFDVENAANMACSTTTDNAIFNDLKNFVYNSPSITIKDKDGEERLYDITLADVCFVLSLPLRDMYLNEHPQIQH